MPSLNVGTVFIVGAGFSHHAGLPLTGGFTEAILFHAQDTRLLEKSGQVFEVEIAQAVSQ
jgi:hypothetical protein